MVTFPTALPKIPYVGFSPVRLQAPGTSQFGRVPFRTGSWVKVDPSIPHGPSQFAHAFETAYLYRKARLDVRGLSFDGSTWAQRSSLGSGYVVPTVNTSRPHPPVWLPPIHFPAELVIGSVFDIQGSSCLVARPSELSPMNSPRLPPSTSAGRSDACILPFFHAGTGHRVEERNSWHLRSLRLN